MAVRHGFAAEEILASGRITSEEIATIREKIKDAAIPQPTDEQIILFILSCDHDLDFTLVTIKEYYRAKKNGPELFNSRNLELQEIEYQAGVVRYSVLPARSRDGCAVMFHGLNDTYFTHYNMEHSMRLLFMTLDAAVYDDPPTGLIILFNMKGVGLMHVTRMRISLIRKFCHYLQEGLPVKLKEIHVLNTSNFIDKVMAIIKPFLKTELLAKIHFHHPNMDMDEFNATVLPKECMPKDFEGTLPDVDTLHEQNLVKLKLMLPYFEAEEKQRRDYYDSAK